MQEISSIRDNFALLLQNPLQHFVASFQYLTIWTIVLVVFHRWTHNCINLLFLTSVVFVFAMYISYIQPGYFKYNPIGDGETYKITGMAKLALDMLGHVVPLLFVVWRYWHYYNQRGMAYSMVTSNAFLIVLIYLMAFDAKYMYDADGMSVVVLTIICLSLYLLIYN